MIQMVSFSVEALAPMLFLKRAFRQSVMGLRGGLPFLWWSSLFSVDTYAILFR